MNHLQNKIWLIINKWVLTKLYSKWFCSTIFSIHKYWCQYKAYTFFKQDYFHLRKNYRLDQPIVIILKFGFIICSSYIYFLGFTKYLTNCLKTNLKVKAGAIQKYKHLNKSSKSVQWAHVSHDDFYRDKLMTFLTLNQG